MVLLIPAAAATTLATPAPVSAAERVICNIVTGADTPAQQLARLYKAVFHRAPEPEGWNYWKGIYETRSLFEIAGHFVLAPEFVNLYGDATNDEFVRLIYQNVMGRDPEPAGYSYWLGVLNRGEATRAQMVVYFSESVEFKRRENDLYLETCPTVVWSNPSVLGGFEFYSSDPGIGLFAPTLDSEYSLAFDAADDTTLYAVVVPGRPTENLAARRNTGESCATVWEQISEFGQSVRAIPSTAEATYDQLWESRTLPSRDMRGRVETFGTTLDFQVTLNNMQLTSCLSDDPLLLTLGREQLRILQDEAADSVRYAGRRVFRILDLDAGELRRAAERDPGLHRLFPSLAEDLELVDELTRFWIDNGLFQYAGRDSVRLTITLSEDLTGNTFAYWGEYRVVLTQEDLNLREWRDQFVVFRLPT